MGVGEEGGRLEIDIAGKKYIRADGRSFLCEGKGMNVSKVKEVAVHLSEFRYVRLERNQRDDNCTCPPVSKRFITFNENNYPLR